MLTGQADMNAVVESIRRIQLFRYMIKPWDPADLERTVREAMAL
jgi:DNA-binding NtrC family response regulator